MFWWIELFAIRGILVFERFASRGIILGNGGEIADLDIVNHRLHRLAENSFD